MPALQRQVAKAFHWAQLHAWAAYCQNRQVPVLCSPHSHLAASFGGQCQFLAQGLNQLVVIPGLGQHHCHLFTKTGHLCQQFDVAMSARQTT